MENRFLNLRSVKRICFIFCYEGESSEEDLGMIMKTLGSTGKEVSGIVVEGKKGLFANLPQELRNQGVIYVERTSVDWTGVLDRVVVEPVAGEDFDLLINFNRKGDFTLNLIMLYVNSKMRVGMMEDKEFPYTLTVAAQDGTAPGYIEFLDQTLHYLKTIGE